MNQMNQPAPMQRVNVNELSSKFKSKKELHHFLVQDCQAFLPPVQSTNIYFYKQIMRGEKDYIKRDKVKVASVPQIEGLTVEDFLLLAKTNPTILRTIPDERDWVHIDKKWLCDIMYTIDSRSFQLEVDKAIKKRKDKLEQHRDLLVEMRPEFIQALNNCLNFSTEHGRSVMLIKPQSKRKRTRAELEEVKQEEEELKTDKQGYLQQVKRLRQEKLVLEGMVADLQPHEYEFPSSLPSPAASKHSQQFTI